MRDVQVYAGAGLMGAVAGMRSLAAPALVSHFVSTGGLGADQPRLGFLSGSVAAKTMAGLAAAEGIADKLPFMPKRTKTGSLIFRALSGALSGAAVCSATKRSVIAGGLIGAGAAIGASFGAYELRRRAGHRFHVPDAVIAVIEDGLAATCGVLVLSQLRSAKQTA